MKCAKRIPPTAVFSMGECAMLGHDVGQHLLCCVLTTIAGAAATASSFRKKETTTSASGASANKGHYNKFQIIRTNNGKQ